MLRSVAKNSQGLKVANSVRIDLRLTQKMQNALAVQIILDDARD
jgi:hypothetical protein